MSALPLNTRFRKRFAVIIAARKGQRLTPGRAFRSRSLMGLALSLVQQFPAPPPPGISNTKPSAQKVAYQPADDQQLDQPPYRVTHHKDAVQLDECGACQDERQRAYHPDGGSQLDRVA